jgi:hypothetical protein
VAHPAAWYEGQRHFLDRERQTANTGNHDKTHGTADRHQPADTPGCRHEGTDIMMETSVVYTFLAWLGCLWLDLLFAVARGPVLPDPLLKFILVTICLVMILIALWRHGWLFGA